MKKCIIIPDSFKGTMASEKVCSIMKEVISTEFPECRVLTIPIADGGEGTVDSFLASMDGEKVYTNVKNAFGENITAFYGKFGRQAVIEMAAAAGIVTNDKLDPMTASTYGVGQLILHAIANGCKKIILGLGGSCTNDAGAGMAAALGTLFYDKNGIPFVPTGGTLSEVCRIDNSTTEKTLKNVEICCMCDIENVICGPEGAAYVFAPQKGANENQVVVLDENLQKFTVTIKKEMGIDVSELKAGGAAGGMGAGAYAFLGAELRKGIELILDAVDFDTLLDCCDYVITGEGKFDSQSLGGKVVVGVAQRAKRKHVPVVAVVGTADNSVSEQEMKSAGITKLYKTVDRDAPFEAIKLHCVTNLKNTMQAVTKYLNL